MIKKDKSVLNKYLEEQSLMSLATVDAEGHPWAASVYFVHDDDFNFYFMSSSDSLHCQNIRVNPNVSFTIADSHQPPGGTKYGLQLSGVAKHVYSPMPMLKTLKLWNKKYVAKPAPPYKKIKVDSPFYKISVNKMKVFDSQSKEKFVEYIFKNN